LNLAGPDDLGEEEGKEKEGKIVAYKGEKTYQCRKKTDVATECRKILDLLGGRRTSLL